MNFYDIEVLKTDGSKQSLSDFKGSVLLIVNTATQCGFTPQYNDLTELYVHYHDKGLEILDFPCNQFGQQAPGTNAEIHEFCMLNFNIPYLQFAKIDVNGSNETELFKYLKSKKSFAGFNNKAHPLNDLLHKMLLEKDASYAEKSDIAWNFTKFLVSKEGSVIKRYEPTEEIEKIENDIVALLNQ